MSLRTGCIVLGVLGILGSLASVAGKKSSTAEIFLYLVNLIVSALLVYGAVKRNRFCVWPWIVANIISVILLIIVLLLCVFASSVIIDLLNDAQTQANMNLTEKEAEDAKSLIGVYVVVVAVVDLICITLIVLFTLVGYSFVCELREEEERQNNDTNAPPKAYNLVPV